MNFYSHEKISDRLYLVHETYKNGDPLNIGVIIGNEKILCIDSGFGVDGKLREYIEKIVGTDKPIIVACTHGHIDHVGGAYLFDEAYLNNADYGQLWTALDPDRRMDDIRTFSNNDPETIQYAKDNFHDNRQTVFKDVNDGDVLDIGGEKIECFRVPGHSNGSIAYLNRAENYAFVGDSCLDSVMIFQNTRDGLMDAALSLKLFADQCKEDTIFYNGHHNETLTPKRAYARVKGLYQVATSEEDIGDKDGDTTAPNSPRGWYPTPMILHRYTCEDGARFGYNWYNTQKSKLHFRTDWYEE